VGISARRMACQSTWPSKSRGVMEPKDNRRAIRRARQYRASNDA
jgi:hypothetical protein